jgi:cytochrome c biogenesis protein CcdA
MLRLIGVVVSIGLADSLNPSTIAPGLYLAAGERPRADVLKFALGVFAVYFVGGAIVALGPGQALLAIVPHPGHTARYIAETVAGTVMLIAAGVLWIKRRQLSQRELPTPQREGKSIFLLGVTITAVELPTAFPYFAAIAAVVGSGFGPGRQLLLIVIYNVCFVAPLLLIALTLAIFGDRAERVLATARRLLQTHWPILLATVALLAGAFVTVLGVTGLASGGHDRLARLARKLRRAVQPH